MLRAVVAIFKQHLLSSTFIVLVQNKKKKKHKPSVPGVATQHSRQIINLRQKIASDYQQCDRNYLPTFVSCVIFTRDKQSSHYPPDMMSWLHITLTFPKWRFILFPQQQ